MSRFTDFLEKNPLIALAATSFAFASAAVGIATYFYSESVKNLREESSLNTARLDLDHRMIIAELTNRLNSIEKQVGTEKLLLNITQIPTLSSQIFSLGIGYEPYLDGRFFC